MGKESNAANLLRGLVADSRSTGSILTACNQALIVQGSQFGPLCQDASCSRRLPVGRRSGISG